MSKKLPKYKKDAVQFLLDWANDRLAISKDDYRRFTKLVYSSEHASITFYPNDISLPEMEVGLEYNVKGRVQLAFPRSRKTVVSEILDDNEVSKLATSVSHVLLKVPFNRVSGREIERSIGFHYTADKGQLSMLGSYGSQYIYPSAN